MSTVDDRIRAKIAQSRRALSAGGDVGSPPWVFLNALVGVLDAHRPVSNLLGDLYCVTCIAGVKNGSPTFQPYPCPTVRAIADALKIDVPGGAS